MPRPTKKKNITKKMNISKVVYEYPETADVFILHGLYCVGCSAAAFETIEQGAAAHGLPVGPLIKDLNKIIKGEKPDIMIRAEEEARRKQLEAQKAAMEKKKSFWERILSFFKKR